MRRTALLAVLALALAACTSNNDAGDSGPAEVDTTTPPSLGSMTEGTLLPPGPYRLTAWGGSAATKQALVDAPEGFYKLGDSTFITPADGAPPFLALSYITVAGVYREGCGKPGVSKDGMLEDPGSSVQDLADALAAQRLTTTTEPVPVTIDGYDGLYLELSTSEKTDFTKCGDEVLDIWASTPGNGGIYAEQPGQHYGIWILDLDGDREVIAWSAYPGAPDEEIRALTDMAESTHFEDR